MPAPKNTRSNWLLPAAFAVVFAALDIGVVVTSATLW